MPTVTITAPSDSPQRVVISPNRETASFGRSSKCDIRISHESVSGKHATLRRLRDGYVLRDMGSTNGTKLEGEKTSEIRLTKSQDIKLGDVIFQFEPDAGDSQSEPKAKTHVLEAEGAPSAKVNVRTGDQPRTENDSVVIGLAAAGAGLIAVGFLVLLGLEAFLAIAERDQEFILGGCVLILIGLLCLASILFFTGRIRLPKLVVQFDKEEKGKRSKEKKRSEDEDEDDEPGEEDDSDEDNDSGEEQDDELGRAPKDEDAKKEA